MGNLLRSVLLSKGAVAKHFDKGDEEQEDADAIIALEESLAGQVRKALSAKFGCRSRRLVKAAAAGRKRKLSKKVSFINFLPCLGVICP